MSRKIDLGKRGGAKKFQKAIMNEMVNQKFNAECPHCKSKIALTLAKPICPRCSKQIEISLK